MKLPHRDDASDELLKTLEELFPGFKIVFAGDLPEDQASDIKEILENLKDMHRQSLVNGECLDCGKKMPGWPEVKLAEGWNYFTELNEKEPTAFICPECDAAEEDDRI